MTINVLTKLASVNPWINDRLLFVVRHGSMAYGTNIEGSDEDFKGVACAPREAYLGFQKKFEQQELKDPDTCIFELKKFFTLASACNPNALEILFVEPEDHVIVNSIGRRIIDARDKFLSKRVRFTFAGYAKAQLARIETHRKWILNPVKEVPLRSDFGLPPRYEIPEGQLSAAKAEISKELEKYNLSHLDDLREDQKIAVQNGMIDILAELHITRDAQWMSAARKIGLNDNFIEYMQKERQYENKKREYDKYNEWKLNRNKERAKDEEKYGVDLKHAYHLVRLLRSCKEILESGKVIVKRPDREELLAIRNGAWSYEQIIEYARTEEAKLDAICAKSKLQGKPDIEWLDKLCVSIVESML